jgi:hypothetical protein
VVSPANSTHRAALSWQYLRVTWHGGKTRSKRREKRQDGFRRPYDSHADVTEQPSPQIDGNSQDSSDVDGSTMRTGSVPSPLAVVAFTDGEGSAFGNAAAWQSVVRFAMPLGLSVRSRS